MFGCISGDSSKLEGLPGSSGTSHSNLNVKSRSDLNSLKGLEGQRNDIEESVFRVDFDETSNVSYSSFSSISQQDQGESSLLYEISEEESLSSKVIYEKAGYEKKNLNFDSTKIWQQITEEQSRKEWEYEEGYLSALQGLSKKYKELEEQEILEKALVFLEAMVESLEPRAKTRRSGGRRDREEVFAELKELASKAKDKLRSSDSWGVGQILDGIILGNGKFSTRQLKYFLGDLHECGGRMWRGLSDGGCDKWRSDD
ncbi:hypothetical protein [Candidatus Mycoplasma haematohominis]|uniref:Uncharacterized protein n=1 Tax=Candidatus Mycoplasma haematohominis TaxID=1494318 RepID=A0A478FRT5_9MOLU|nr:hypothetical protein [Candidatus Mycoplasma haemohominis]GCE63149.1 hypothetical protein MHSWG343_01270 [Candidatus Mycoplasma haemohominis]